MQKVGVGVISAGRRTLRPYLLSAETMFHVEYDRERKGIAPTRNACLRELYVAGCEHFFLFDDDCWPTMPGWDQYFIEGHRRTGIQYFGLPEIFKAHLLQASGEVMRWDNIIGCFGYQTRHAVDVLGGWNDEYQRYGFEDTGRHARLRRSALLGPGQGFPSLLRAPAFIHSADVFGENPEPSLSREEKEHWIAINRPALDRERASSQLFYPFSK